MYNIGRPQDYFDVFGGKLYFNYDYLIIGCHGDGGKIIVPILGENVYYPNECRNNIGYEELQGSVKIRIKPLYAPDVPQVPEIYAKRLIEITISLLLLRIISKATAVCCLLWTCFIICPTDRVLKTAAGANSIDSETQLYNFYSWYFYYKDGKFRFTSSGGVSPKLLNHKPPCAEPTVLSVNGFPSKLQQTFSTSE